MSVPLAAKDSARAVADSAAAPVMAAVAECAAEECFRDPSRQATPTESAASTNAAAP
jgi:hypothetical protein